MPASAAGRGPLAGIRVIEMQGLGPLPFCGMVLADMGADVITVSPPGETGTAAATEPADYFRRGKHGIAIDLKQPDGVQVVREMAQSADVLAEGFRPGVMERLGLGPSELLEQCPRLIYGRMTGWGQEGPLAQMAGHDINYIGIAGALEPIGRAGDIPVPPLALVGDFGGGGLLLAMGICAALVERASSGRGQVVDAACVDGASLLMTIVHWLRAIGRWTDKRGANLFDSGAPFYDVYETADSKFVALGAIEPRFYAELVDILGIDTGLMNPQYDRSQWAERKQLVAAAISGRTRAEWAARAAGRDACLSEVLAPREVADHPHHRARRSFLRAGDGADAVQPAAAPRFSRTPAQAGEPAPAGQDAAGQVLESFGLAPGRISELRARAVIT
jgi:alpha-methylacyl-CoA racemase